VRIRITLNYTECFDLCAINTVTQKPGQVQLLPSSSVWTLYKVGETVTECIKHDFKLTNRHIINKQAYLSNYNWLSWPYYFKAAAGTHSCDHMVSNGTELASGSRMADHRAAGDFQSTAWKQCHCGVIFVSAVLSFPFTFWHVL